jgi:N-acyl homoserine lactone hydrolase
MLTFTLIREGVFDMNERDGVTICRPSCSLIQGPGCSLLVDTAHPADDPDEFVRSLGKTSLTPHDIDALVFTHLHPDHFGHKDLFTDAIHCFHKDEKLAFCFKKNKTHMFGQDMLLPVTPDGLRTPLPVALEPDLHELGEMLYIRHIPGHTNGSVMIFACIDGKIHCWAGGTFLNRDYYDRWQPPGASIDQEMVYRHMEYARDNADIIIPGHGAPFAVT